MIVRPIYQAFTMTESEHDSLLEKVQSTEVRKGRPCTCSNDCTVGGHQHLLIVFRWILFSTAFILAEIMSSVCLMLQLYLTLSPIQPPVYCLMATVKEAKGILGKDITGEFSPLQMRYLAFFSDAMIRTQILWGLGNVCITMLVYCFVFDM